MRPIVSAMLVIVGLIHLLPLSGVLGADRLTALYGLDFSDPSLAILMRHRAVLFGLLGLFLVAAAFRPAWVALALVAGTVSVVSFLLLAWCVGDYNAAVARVVMADAVALACLAVAAVAQLIAARRHTPGLLRR
jgi:hypothetical protein